MSIYPAPTLETDSYGTIAGVEALTKIFTDDGIYTSDTNPTDSTVAMWIDQMSDSFNLALANAGFTVPVVQVDAAAILAHKVEMTVADLCNLANNTGRFFTARAREMGLSPELILEREINSWVTLYAQGLVNLGVPRSQSTLGTIGSKGHDSHGQKIPAIFQRDAFGNKFEDWDA